METGSLGKKTVIIGLVIGLVIGLGIEYWVTQPQIDYLKGKNDILQAQIDERDHQIETLQSKIDEKDDQITTLKSQISQLESKIDERDNQITGLRSQISELRSEVDEKGSQIKTLRSQLDELRLRMGEWDYVVLGDSKAWGFYSLYAAHIEADLGVEVTVHNWIVGGWHSTEMLSALRNNQKLRNDISDAEVITLYMPHRHLKEPLESYLAGTCGGADNQDCLREAVSLFKADVYDTIAEILSLRSTSDTIIRTMDIYNPLVGGNHPLGGWKERGIFEDLKPYWMAFNDCIV